VTRLISTALPGVVVLEPHVHSDGRGFFVEVYNVERLRSHGIDVAFVQDNHSRSVRGTLRGLHWQFRRPQAKLVRVVQGEIFDVAVDIRRGSPTFGTWMGVTLSGENFRQTFIPEGFAHGFCVISETADVEYKCSDYYDPGGEAGLVWNDPAIGIAWPVESPLLSPRDAAHASLAEARHLPTLGSAGALIWSS
jgi:dTDP-4-dehydrorhamnose 3,5-epimerase